MVEDFETFFADESCGTSLIPSDKLCVGRWSEAFGVWDLLLRLRQLLQRVLVLRLLRVELLLELAQLALRGGDGALQLRHLRRVFGSSWRSLPRS